MPPVPRTNPPSGFNPSPISHAPNMPAPRPHPEVQSTGEASSTSEADFGFPTKTPENEVSSCCLLQGPRRPPGTVGCSPNHMLVELAAEPQGRSGRPRVPVKKLRQRKRRGIQVPSLVSGSSGQCLFLDKGHYRLSLLKQWLLPEPLTGPEVLQSQSCRPLGDGLVMTQLGGRQGPRSTQSHTGEPLAL